MSEPTEFSESGEGVFRHKERKHDFEPAFGDVAGIERIEAHIRQFVGEPEEVFHEFVSDLIHVDVHVVRPAAARNWFTLVTSGMSDRPMHTEKGEEEFRYAELLMCLPPDWPLDDAGHEWPVELLKFLARMPHQYETFFAENHSVANGQPPEDLPGTRMNAMLLTTPRTLSERFRKLKINEEKTIHFWAVIPLFDGEMKLKLKKGTEALLARLTEQNVTEVLDVNRKNTAGRFLGLF